MFSAYTNHSLKDFILPFPMETMHGWTTAGSLRSKNIKRTDLPPQYKANFVLGRTCQAKVEPLPPSIWPASCLKDTQ